VPYCVPSSQFHHSHDIKKYWRTMEYNWSRIDARLTKNCMILAVAVLSQNTLASQRRQTTDWRHLMAIAELATELQRSIKNSYKHIAWDYPQTPLVFSRTWLRYVRVFAVAILSVVCNVRAPYQIPYQSLRKAINTVFDPTQPVEIFAIVRQCFYAFCSLAIHWPPCKNFTKTVPGERLRRK